VHIPIYEYIDLYNGNSFFGKYGETINCQSVNTGLFTAVKDLKAVDWISVGHDHNNEFYGEYEGIKLSYGRKTGYGGYGPRNLLHGGRVLEVTAEPYSIDTWIR